LEFVWYWVLGNSYLGKLMSHLFDPLKIRHLELRNRVVFAPVVTNFGLRNERTRKYYAERARGGAGLIVVHGTPVDLFLNPGWAEKLRGLVEEVHDQGAAIAIQLWHGNDLNGQAVAPSARGAFRAVTAEEIRTVTGKFAAAARVCRDVGFDGAEVHGAHGYFVHQFFSPLTNSRGDEYGGSVERRMRFALELVRAMRKAAGEKFLVLYRHSAFDGEPGGTAIEDSVSMAKAMQTHWLDVIDVSAGMGQKDSLSIPDASSPEGTHAGLAGAIKAAVSIPVIAVGRIQTPEAAGKILKDRKADLIALGRQLLADPHWPKKVQEGREAEITFCTYCDTCTSEMRAGRPISCPQNPELGSER